MAQIQSLLRWELRTVLGPHFSHKALYIWYYYWEICFLCATSCSFCFLQGPHSPCRDWWKFQILCLEKYLNISFWKVWRLLGSTESGCEMLHCTVNCEMKGSQETWTYKSHKPSHSEYPKVPPQKWNRFWIGLTVLEKLKSTLYLTGNLDATCPTLALHQAYSNNSQSTLVTNQSFY